jgi:predicted NBD/HSP70 family sugar kinase
MRRNRNLTATNGAQPADQKTVRRHNLGLVLKNVAQGDRKSRAKVSAETGLNPSTVSSLVTDLIEWGLVREVGIEQDGSVGRPGRSLELNPDGGAALGIEIGDDGIGVLAIDLARTVRYRAFISQENGDRDPVEVIRQTAQLASEALAAFRSKNITPVCTIALPGLVAPGGVLLRAPNIGWNDVPVVELWRATLGNIPLVIENEARLAAYAEMMIGLAQDIRTFAYISGGRGIGSGLVIDRNIYRGPHGFAGEFGHTIIDFSRSAPVQGNAGSLQSLAGERALLEMAGLVVGDSTGRSDPDWMGREIARRASSGDRMALAAIETAGNALAVGIANLYNLFDMEAIILGGYFTHVAEWLRAPIKCVLQAQVNAEHWAALPILFSEMGREAAVRGAAARSLNAILERAGEHEAGGF